MYCITSIDLAMPQEIADWVPTNCFRHRRQRIQDLKRAAAVKRFGSVLEIGSADFVREVTHAGEGVWAIVLLYKDGYVRAHSSNH